MKNIFSLIALLTFTLVSNGKEPAATININAKKAADDQKKSLSVGLFKTIPGWEGKLIQKEPVVSGQASITLPLKEPMWVHLALLFNDSIIKRTSDFLLTDDIINAEFDSEEGGAKILGGENEFLFKHRRLLFSFPEPLTRYPEFSIARMAEQYAYEPVENIAFYQTWKEYETNILDIVKDHNDYYFVLEEFFAKAGSLPLKTVETGFSLFADTLKQTELGKKFGSYIENRKSLLIGQPLKDFNVYDDKGKSIKSSQLYSGNKNTILLFWASWCGPCRQEMRKIKTEYDKIDTTKVRLISISIDTDKSSWLQAWQYEKIGWESYVAKSADGESELVHSLFLDFIPQAFILDGSGKIIGRQLNDEILKSYFRKD